MLLGSDSLNGRFVDHLFATAFFSSRLVPSTKARASGGRIKCRHGGQRGTVRVVV